MFSESSSPVLSTMVHSTGKAWDSGVRQQESPRVKERMYSPSLIVFCARHLARHLSGSQGAAVIASAFIHEDAKAQRKGDKFEQLRSTQF